LTGGKKTQAGREGGEGLVEKKKPKHRKEGKTMLYQEKGRKRSIPHTVGAEKGGSPKKT